MSTWFVACGLASGDAGATAGSTRYYNPMGYLEAGTTEAGVQAVARDTFTWANGYIRVTANATSGASTLTSRKNTAAGAMSITIGAAATGVFQDTANSDSLVDGDLFCWRIVTGAGGAITATIVASTLASSSNKSPTVVCRAAGKSSSPGATYPTQIAGFFTSADPETGNYYTVRTATTFSNLRTRVNSNSLNGASTIKSRVDGANGAQTVTVGAAATGFFEDTTNSDTVAVASTINILLDTTAASTGGITTTYYEMYCAGNARPTLAGYAQPAGVNSALTRYNTPEGSSLGTHVTATEANAQVDPQVSFTAQNMLIRVKANTLNGAATFTDRKNGAAGGLSVTVGAAATGAFEDNSGSTSYVAGDLVCNEIITAGSAGNIQITLWGWEQVPAAGGGGGGVSRHAREAQIRPYHRRL